MSLTQEETKIPMVDHVEVRSDAWPTDATGANKAKSQVHELFKACSKLHRPYKLNRYKHYNRARVLPRAGAERPGRSQKLA